MASSDTKLQQPTAPALPSPGTHEAYRVKSIATRLTEAELSEIEEAASRAGEKVSEWLRDTSLAHVRAPQEAQTDPVLLAEIMGMRALMLNLFAKASQGPEDMRKMSAYADAIKSKRPANSCPKAVAKHHQIGGESTMQWSALRRAFPWRTGLLMCSIPALALAAPLAWFRWELPPLEGYYLMALLGEF
jgi:hypothetical protein